MIHIVCTIDRHYFRHCAIMLFSLFHNNKDKKITVHILHDELSVNKQKQLERLISPFAADLLFYKIDKAIFKDAHLSHHVTTATYYRLLIPEILDASIDKVIFLDSDIIVRKDITQLWSTDIEHYYLAAVENPKFNNDVEFRKRLLIPEGYAYFNAGVLVMNLQKWREHNLKEKIIRYIYENAAKLLQHDQDALNANLYAAWKKLPLQWNVQYVFFKNRPFTSIGISDTEVKESIKDPAILHFTGSNKPWLRKNKHPYRSEYFKYRNMVENFNPAIFDIEFVDLIDYLNDFIWKVGLHVKKLKSWKDSSLAS